MGWIVGDSKPDPLTRAAAAVSWPDLFLALNLDQFQHPELLFRDIRQRDRQPDVFGSQDSEASPHESAIRRVHCLF